jgi:hypothetical protein
LIVQNSNVENERMDFWIDVTFCSAGFGDTFE